MRRHLDCTLPECWTGRWAQDKLSISQETTWVGLHIEILHVVLYNLNYYSSVYFYVHVYMTYNYPLDITVPAWPALRAQSIAVDENTEYSFPSMREISQLSLPNASLANISLPSALLTDVVSGECVLYTCYTSHQCVSVI